MSRRMTKKKIISILDKEIKCEDADFETHCSTTDCGKCKYYNTNEIMLEAYKAIIEILNEKDRCEDDGK